MTKKLTDEQLLLAAKRRREAGRTQTAASRAKWNAYARSKGFGSYIALLGALTRGEYDIIKIR